MQIWKTLTFQCVLYALHTEPHIEIIDFFQWINFQLASILSGFPTKAQLPEK